MNFLPLIHKLEEVYPDTTISITYFMGRGQLNLEIREEYILYVQGVMTEFFPTEGFMERFIHHHVNAEKAKQYKVNLN